MIRFIIQQVIAGISKHNTAVSQTTSKIFQTLEFIHFLSLISVCRPAAVDDTSCKRFVRSDKKRKFI